MSKMNPVVHFEMPAEDPKRMADFYSAAFGWQYKEMGSEMGHYVTVSTTETGEDGRPKMAGAINGGIYPRQEGVPNCPSVVIAVEDIRDSMKKISDSGGRVLGEPAEIPGIGMFVSFTDTEGNRGSILQPLR